MQCDLVPRENFAREVMDGVAATYETGADFPADYS